ncbi:hypothetical protein BKA93DRAFT_784516 [Sparassis latifolia]|uniref:Methyltransferase ausD n=1 Tax=Sparassis crispa TaxID=139825 RepID=A0A401G7L5_9APHY|nr:hypothetical protein SCP_0110480 [Sparassis crispa]GBE78165.1 hypothetical protein SCP_0110480 [Sparassis crispa]
MAREDNEAAIPLDRTQYDLSDQDIEFFASQVGIRDRDALKDHILNIQAEAYEVYPYPCIRLLSFAKLRISFWLDYQQLLKLGKERKGAIFLEMGCCVGTDPRKVAADGFPAENIIASDIEPGFWELGHKLFKSTPETFPARFVPGDALDQSFLQVVPPFYSPPNTAVPALSSLTTLTPLAGHVSAIHSALFFHLFDEAQQLQLARALAGLLSPEPGSLLFGAHGGRVQKGLGSPISRGRRMFCHSPESWAELWNGQVFRKGTVEVNSRLVEVSLPTTEGEEFTLLVWSVVRL